MYLSKYYSIIIKIYKIIGSIVTNIIKNLFFSRHSNDSIHREEIINDLAEIIKKKNPGNRANLKNPELAVVVEVIRGVCLISVAPDYYKYRKYNLLEICAVKQNVACVKVYYILMIIYECYW